MTYFVYPTAKPDVVADIRDHFSKQLGIALQTLIGGVSRENLLNEVHATPAQAKFPEVLRLVEETLQGEGHSLDGFLPGAKHDGAAFALQGFLNQAQHFRKFCLRRGGMDFIEQVFAANSADQGLQGDAQSLAGSGRGCPRRHPV